MMSSKLLTIGEVARLEGCAIHQVQHIVKTRGIEPEQRAAGYRLFGPAAVAKIRAELRDIERRGARRGEAA